MQKSITILPTQTCSLSNTFQVDAEGVKLTTQDPTYGAPVWTNSDNTVATLGGDPPHYLQPTGKLGTTTATSTETSSDPTKPVLTSTVILTVEGPAAADLETDPVAN